MSPDKDFLCITAQQFKKCTQNVQKAHCAVTKVECKNQDNISVYCKEGSSIELGESTYLSK